MTKIRLKYINEYTDKTGKLRRYFRRDGKQLGPLPGAPGSEEFMDAYKGYLGNKPAVKTSKTEGSFGRLVTDFYGSQIFRKNLKESSRRAYKSVLEPLAKAHGHRSVEGMTSEAVQRILDRIAEDRPAMANLTRSVLRRLMKFAVKSKAIKSNPVVDIAPYEVGEHHTWTDGELAQFERKWPVGTRERLAYALLLYTMQRVGDVSRMSRADIVDGHIPLIQEKTGVELSVPIHADLTIAMKGWAARGMTLIGDENGRPLTAKALAAFMSRAIDDAGLPGRCVPHGLRKAGMRLLAENGATEKEIAGMSGHKSLREIQRYTKAADQKKLARAALDKLENKRRTKVHNQTDEIGKEAKNS